MVCPCAEKFVIPSCYLGCAFAWYALMAIRALAAYTETDICEYFFCAFYNIILSAEMCVSYRV